MVLGLLVQNDSTPKLTKIIDQDIYLDSNMFSNDLINTNYSIPYEVEVVNVFSNYDQDKIHDAIRKYEIDRFYSGNMISSDMLTFWSTHLNNPSALIKANSLWWSTPGARFEQNALLIEYAHRDELIDPYIQPYGSDLIELNKYIIIVDTQNIPFCGINPNDESKYIVPIPFIQFLMPKTLGQKFLQIIDDIDDCFGMRRNNVVYINNNLESRSRNGPPLDITYTYSIRSGDRFKNIRYTENDPSKWLVNQILINLESFGPFIMYANLQDQFKPYSNLFDYGFIMSNALVNGRECDPTDNLYERLLKYIKSVY